MVTPLLSDDINVQMVAVVNAWKNADFKWRNYTPNGLDNMLYNIYCIQTFKELWDFLEKKYKTKNIGLNILVDGKFLE